MNKITIRNDNRDFEFIFLKGANPTRAVIFSAGSGGNPERHLPLLNFLTESGCTVIAPYFERIVSPMPSAEELHLCVTSLQSALDFISELNLPIVGIGHSIGATLLLSLAGGQMWMRSGQCLSIDSNEQLKKLVLFSPPTGFFQAPNSLDTVQIPIQAWGGALDTITPPESLEILNRCLLSQKLLDINIIEGAGHFTFMDILPPHIVDPMKKRDEFLARLSTDVCKFVMS